MLRRSEPYRYNKNYLNVHCDNMSESEVILHIEQEIKADIESFKEVFAKKGWKYIRLHEENPMQKTASYYEDCTIYRFTGDYILVFERTELGEAIYGT